MQSYHIGHHNKKYSRVFAKEVVEKVKELDEEKKKTEKAFHDFLPPSVVRDIKNKKVICSNHSILCSTSHQL